MKYSHRHRNQHLHSTMRFYIQTADQLSLHNPWDLFSNSLLHISPCLSHWYSLTRRKLQLLDGLGHGLESDVPQSHVLVLVARVAIHVSVEQPHGWQPKRCDQQLQIHNYCCLLTQNIFWVTDMIRPKCKWWFSKHVWIVHIGHDDFPLFWACLCQSSA